MTQPQIEFDPVAHRYTLNGQELMSVTTILKEAGLIDDRWFTDESRARGTAVHEAVFYDIHSDLHVESLHKTIQPYVEAWFRFKRDCDFVPKTELCEARMYHPLHGYAGTPDLVGILNGRPVLIDIKTGDCPTARYQTAAYREFPRVRAISPDRFSLRLFPDGRFKLSDHKNPNDFHVFLEALQKVKNKEREKIYA